MGISLDLKVGHQLCNHIQGAELSLKMFQEDHAKTGGRKVEISYAKATLTNAVQRLRDFVREWNHGPEKLPGNWMEALRVHDPGRESSSGGGSEEVLLHDASEVQGLLTLEEEGLVASGSADARLGSQSGRRTGRLHPGRVLPIHRGERTA
jgi:hypothetical protein